MTKHQVNKTRSVESTARRTILAAPLIAAFGVASAPPAAGHSGAVSSSNSKVGQVLVDSSTDASIASLLADLNSLSRAAVSTEIDDHVYNGTPTFKGDVTRDVIAKVGTKLQLNYIQGYAGQRLELTGQPQAPGVDPIMPYMQVVPTTQEGTDGGGAIAGYQLYRLGSGDTNDREFLAIEATDTKGGNAFRISSIAYGSGVLRDLNIGVYGAGDMLKFQAASQKLIATRSLTLDHLWANNPIPIDHRANNSTTIRFRSWSNSVDGTTFFIGKNRGKFGGASLPPNSGDHLGDFQFGSTAGTSGDPRVGAMFRAQATEAWTFGTAQGTKMMMFATEAGTATQVRVAELNPEIADRETVLLIRNRLGSVKRLSRVSVGDQDSGGVGYRALRIVN